MRLGARLAGRADGECRGRVSRAVAPAPDAFPRWGMPQASPGSDNVALASSQSLGQAPSLDFPLPFRSAFLSGTASIWDQGTHGNRGWISQRVRCHRCPAFPRPAGSRWLFYFPPAV